MKQLLFTLVLIVAADAASADNYFTLRTDISTAVNDTLRISPSDVGQFSKMYLTTHFDGYLDHWYLKITHPSNMYLYTGTDEDLRAKEGPAMSIPYYYNAQGDTATHHAVLTTNIPNQTENTSELASYFSSTISVMGYWDPNNTGNYVCYGTVKWEPGYHDFLISFSIKIPVGCTEADVTLEGALTSTADGRNYTLVNDYPEKTIHLIVGYQLGDATGDGQINMVDVALVNDWLLFGFDGATDYQIAAADMNGDGEVTIDDLSMLIDYILYN